MVLISLIVKDKVQQNRLYNVMAPTKIVPHSTSLKPKSILGNIQLQACNTHLIVLKITEVAFLQGLRAAITVEVLHTLVQGIVLQRRMETLIRRDFLKNGGFTNHTQGKYNMIVIVPLLRTLVIRTLIIATIITMCDRIRIHSSLKIYKGKIVALKLQGIIISRMIILTNNRILEVLILGQRG